MGKKTIAVAVSGGVDSLLSLILLRERGEEVLAVHGKFLEGDRAGQGLEEICRKLGAPFVVLDLRKEFERLVQDRSCGAIWRAAHPIPARSANPEIKFGTLWDKVREAGSREAGHRHYDPDGGGPGMGPGLCAGSRCGKDQSYS